jgi:hypothetical protein
LTEYEAYNLAKSTWGAYIPVFHFSDTDIKLNNPRAHADYPTVFHDEYNNTDDIHLECEFKAKDYAIEYIQTKLTNS